MSTARDRDPSEQPYGAVPTRYLVALELLFETEPYPAWFANSGAADPIVRELMTRPPEEVTQARNELVDHMRMDETATLNRPPGTVGGGF